MLVFLFGKFDVQFYVVIRKPRTFNSYLKSYNFVHGAVF